MEMEKTAGDGDWEHLKSFFTDDVLFKVGASQERRGNRAIIDYLGWMFSMLELNPPFEFRGTWEQGDVVIIQVDAKFTRRSDGKPITFPSVDIFRFDGDKIREWRVYTDQTELFSDEGRVKLHSPRRYA
jgi:ketosteroid isomerase-like protein